MKTQANGHSLMSSKNDEQKQRNFKEQTQTAELYKALSLPTHKQEGLKKKTMLGSTGNRFEKENMMD